LAFLLGNESDSFNRSKTITPHTTDANVNLRSTLFRRGQTK
jgi:hypothetical protein